MVLLLLLFFHALINYLQYEASPFYKNFNKNEQLYTKKTVHYLHCGSSFSYRLHIACNYLHIFSLSSYTCLNCQHFTTVLHPVMGTWIVRYITDVPYLVMGTWIAWNAGLASWQLMPKSYIY